MSVRVLSERVLKAGKERALAEGLKQMRILAMKQPGYIGSEALHDAENRNKYVILSKWHSIDDWESWVSNLDRSGIQKKLAELQEGDTTHKVFYVPRSDPFLL